MPDEDELLLEDDELLLEEELVDEDELLFPSFPGSLQPVVTTAAAIINSMTLGILYSPSGIDYIAPTSIQADEG